MGKDSRRGPFAFNLANDLLAHALLAGVANDSLLDGFEPAEFLFGAAFSETKLCEVVGFTIDANSVVGFLKASDLGGGLYLSVFELKSEFELASIGGKCV